jgi:hypothetical protein
MMSPDEADIALSSAVIDNREQRGRIQAQLVLIQSLALALDAEMDFQLKPPPPAE